MSRLTVTILCTGACLAASTGATRVSAAGAAGHSRAQPPARMLVYAQEWRMYGSRASVPAGRVIVQLWNRGQDAHDLRIRRLNPRGQMVGGAQKVAITQSGAISQAHWKLGTGRYELYCSLFQHLQRGMRTRLTVR